MERIQSDILIIGAGIMGLAMARHLRKKFPARSVVLIEKEPDICRHASGRNSGVLHAGFYYSADSLKARFTREGNRDLTDYCRARGLKINPCRKVVVTRTEEELEALFELERRGRANGVDVRIIDEKELASIDPNVRTRSRALLSPTTATVDPVQVCGSIRDELVRDGVALHCNCRYERSLGGNAVKTSRGIFEAGLIINAAGLYADRIARDFGFGADYVIIPFKGIYLKYCGSDRPVSMNVYPVPDLRNPFLGVHYTITVDGTVKIGPTAIPALWRENYGGAGNFRAGEFFQIVSREAVLFARNSFGFRSLALEEMKKYHKKYFIGLAAGMVREIDRDRFNEWSRPGIRAQLLDLRTNRLVQDFVVESDGHSIHILNAVSPAFTGSFPFSRWIIDTHVR